MVDDPSREGSAVYYRADPAQYIRTRLLSLTVLAARSDAIVDVLRDGVTYGDVSLQAPAEIGPSPEPFDGIDEYIVLESELLLHHAAETLLRLYLAHEDPMGTPWAKHATLRAPRAFPLAVGKRFDGADLTDERRRSIGRVLLAGEEPWGDHGEDDWHEMCETLDRVLHTFATVVREWGSLYNTAKHGIAVVSDAGSVTVTAVDEPDAEPLVLLEGTYLEHLDAKWHKGRAGYDIDVVGTWVDAQANVAATAIAGHMIGSLWDVGRFHHNNGPKPRVWLPHGVDPSTLKVADRGGTRHTIAWLKGR